MLIIEISSDFLLDSAVNKLFPSLDSAVWAAPYTQNVVNLIDVCFNDCQCELCTYIYIYHTSMQHAYDNIGKINVHIFLRHADAKAWFSL